MLSFLPFVTHFNELTHTDLLCLFGVRIWMPWARLAARGWAKRQIS